MVCYDNINPLFYRAIDLDYEVDDAMDLLTYPPFIFDIFDYDDDLFDKTPDFLCRCVVEPEDCAIKVLGPLDQFDRKRSYTSYLETKEYHEKHGIMHKFVDSDGNPYPDDRGLQKGTTPEGFNRNKNFKEVPMHPKWHPCYYAAGQP
jgi:hypothetical protein